MENGRTGRAVQGRQESEWGSPASSPMHRHVRSGSAGVANFRRQQNTAARAAAQRLARVMAHQPAEHDDRSSSDGEDDDEFDAAPPIGLRTPRRSFVRSPSPAVAMSPALGCYLAEQTSTVHSTSAGQPSNVVKPVTFLSPVKPLSRPPASTLSSESPMANRREKRMSVDLGILDMQETGHTRAPSALQDEIDLLQEENEKVMRKLRLVEGRCKEAEMRAKQLEKQAALRSAAETNDASEEIVSLRLESETARKKATSAAAHLHKAECELKSLRTLAQRMMLTQEDIEELVLKRCWLARYWKLCVQHGIHVEIAEKRHEYWSSLAPLPLEVVLSAGQKARNGFSSDKAEVEDMHKVAYEISDLAGEENIQSMLLVEKGMTELAYLKVEEAVLLAMAQHRLPTIKPSQFASDLVLPIEGQTLVEAFELSQEESEDVLFKQAWLTYIWRRVKNHGLEAEIADERFRYWSNQSTHSPTSHDAVDVGRGLLELKKLGIENQLWEVSRKSIDQDSIDPAIQTTEL